MSGAHRVRRLRFEVAAADERALDPLRGALRPGLEGLILPHLQAAFDEAGAGDALVHFGRVEVDLGTMTAQEAGSDVLARRMGEGLAAALRDAETMGSGASGGEPLARPSAEAILARFLATGTLAWQEPGAVLTALFFDLDRLDEAEFAAVAERLRPVLARRASAERLAWQFPARLAARFAAALSGAARPNAAIAPSQAVEGGPPDAAALASRVVAAARGEPFPSAAAPGAHPADPSSPEPQPQPHPHPPPGLSPVQASPDAAGDDTPEAAPADTQSEPAATRREAAAAPDEPAPACHFAAAAGLVLLHPFLAAFFQRAGLTDGRDMFLGKEERRRAPLLAHFLATGRDDAAEPDLLLAKLLTGLPFEEPVPRWLEATEAERELAEGLLAAAIGHWQKLGNTSAAALRETFLERPGRLERQGEGWRLSVEPRTVDVLLDSLPWTISIVKTPWMSEILRVDWR
jgi:hypothetical protein